MQGPNKLSLTIALTIAPTFARAARLATVAIVVLGAFAVRPRPCRAADPREVETLIAEGTELRRQGKDERALPLFQKAYGIERTPRSAGQLGLAEMAVGYWLSAESHLAEALEASTHPWVSKNQSVLASALETVRNRIGEVAINGSPAGARVTVNGQNVGTFPLSAPVRVGEGRVEIAASAPGYVTALKSLRVNGGEKQQLTLALSESPSQKSSEATGEGTAPTAANTDASPAGEGLASRRTLAFVAGGAAIASLAFAVFETVRWQNKQDEFAKHVGMPTPTANQTTCGELDPGRGASGCSGIYDAAKSAWTLSLVGYAVGGLFAAGAAYLFFTDGSGAHTKSDQQALRCTPTVGALALHLEPAGLGRPGVSCTLRF